MTTDHKGAGKPEARLTADKGFGMSPENLELAVRLGQSRMLEGLLSKLNEHPDLFTEAMDAAKAEDQEAFIAALQKAGVSPRQAAGTWQVVVNIITVQW